MNGGGAALTALFGAVILCCPRRWALLGMLAGVLYLPQEQQVVLAGFHLTAIRLLTLAGFARVLARREFSLARLNGLDRVFFLFYAYTTLVFLARSKIDQAYQIGTAVDAFLGYFAFSGLVGDFEDFKQFLGDFALLLVPYAAFLVYETETGKNLFTLLGAQELGWTRRGRPRCFGSFRNPTLLGTLGSSFLPLYAALWLDRQRRLLTAIGGGLCVFIVWASNSGGSLSCLGVGIIGWMLWKARARMRLVRRTASTTILAMGVVMNAPIWYVLDRISSFTGGAGYHRSRLLDLFFQNIGKWWLAGMPVAETRDWFPYWLPGGATDLCCVIVSYGVSAGLGGVILFLVLLTKAFKSIGVAVARAGEALDDGREALLWGLGVMLSVHVFNWLGVTYFDQTNVYCLMQLASISRLSEPCPETLAPETDAASDAAEGGGLASDAGATGGIWPSAEACAPSEAC
jgi:hypothetical protein